MIPRSTSDLPLWRTTDPTTSRAAAIRHARPSRTNCAKALAAVREHPGSTAKEIAEYAGLERHEASRRLADLKRRGFVVTGPVRDDQTTWNAHEGATA